VISTHKLVVKRGVWQWVQCMLICVGLAGCALPPPEGELVVPNTGSQAVDPSTVVEPSKSVFRVIEYPLVEQSTDNPNHPGFAEHAMQAVGNRRAGFGFLHPVDIVEAPNEALAPYGYQISHSSSAPFSTYVISYHGAPIVQDITRFWQIDHPGVEDFYLVAETLSGDLIAASNGSVETLVSAPQPVDNRLAYAGEGMPMLSGGTEAASAGSDTIFQQEIEGKTLALYHRERLVHLSYDGGELHNTYDAVVYAGGPESAMYNPDASGRLMWFYALRDGLWYYVEAGMME